MTTHLCKALSATAAAGLILMAATCALASDPLFTPTVSYYTGSGPTYGVAGDFNEDGHIDLAVAHESHLYVGIFLGTGNGTFAVTQSYVGAYEHYSIVSGDFNEDGHADLVVPSYPTGNVYVLLGIGDGSFASAVSYYVGEAPVSITAGDFNEDGHMDLAATPQLPSEISIILGVGDGTFAAPTSYGIGSNLYSVTTGDFNEDGHTDLVAAERYVNSVRIVSGLGDGTFTAGGSYGTGTEPCSVNIGDFNEDGHADLVTANHGSDNVSILLGAGNGTFATHADYGAGDASRSVSVGDFDEDGHADLAVANQSSYLADDYSISIILGVGDGSFHPAVNYDPAAGPYTGEQPYHVILGDFDEDGHTDLASVNWDTEDVSVLINQLSPDVVSISDIPNDQGRQVRMTWGNCYHDAAGTSLTITEYVLYRKIDAYLSAHSGSSDKGQNDTPVGVEDNGGSLLYPPGDWDYLESVPACAEQEYSVVVPTLADSTVAEGMYYSTFFVRALTPTPGVYFDSAPDSGYSVDNLAPGVPEGLAVVYNSGSGNSLSWQECEDEDFQYFRIYRSEDEGFEPAPSNLVHATSDIYWQDPVAEGWRYHYKVTALDHSGNESAAATSDQVTGTDMAGPPAAISLHQNCPNPFNPVTTITFDLPAKARVVLAVYDINGARVRLLLNEDMPAGRWSVEWNGKSDGGEDLASGVYFCRFSTAGFEQTRKMILLK